MPTIPGRRALRISTRHVLKGSLSSQPASDGFSFSVAFFARGCPTVSPFTYSSSRTPFPCPTRTPSPALDVLRRLVFCSTAAAPPPIQWSVHRRESVPAALHGASESIFFDHFPPIQGIYPIFKKGRSAKYFPYCPSASNTWSRNQSRMK